MTTTRRGDYRGTPESVHLESAESWSRQGPHFAPMAQSHALISIAHSLAYLASRVELADVLTQANEQQGSDKGKHSPT